MCPVVSYVVATGVCVVTCGARSEFELPNTTSQNLFINKEVPVWGCETETCLGCKPPPCGAVLDKFINFI